MSRLVIILERDESLEDSARQSAVAAVESLKGLLVAIARACPVEAASTPELPVGKSEDVAV